ncbi:hypothetical protein JCM19237_4207 [Photobacterium aphoticum]|uniref:Uncharacterized protein n=1 Tax=Photobacterium aphoticum TaxID=754436 RepID=A0A090QPJ6_9GAMM|nr:hypothetical protein JCM19237_4207 [Photobacterium aphoticum]
MLYLLLMILKVFRFLLAHGVDLNAVAEKTGEDIFTFGERIIASHPTENNIMMIRLLKSQ